MKKKLAVAAFVAACVALVVAATFYFVSRDGDDTLVEQAMAEARNLPLVGLVLDDVPDADVRLRAALREELRRPTMDGAPRPLLLMSELRATHVVPALRATDTANAHAVLEARLALMRHLKTADPTACRELALVGIQRAERLDATGQALMRNMLAAMEKAYRAGRATLSSGASPPALSDGEAGALLAEAGLEKADFDRLRTLARLSSDDACDLAIRLNETPARLPSGKAASLARYLAAAQ